MELDKPLSASANQTALQQAELAAINRMLSISEGTFSLSIVICNSPSLREYLINKITEQKIGIEKISIEKNCIDVLAFVEKKITNEKPSAIFITEIENALPSDEAQPRIIGNLNASRELWQQKFSCPIVFWMAEYASAILQRDAPDFASWLSHIFEFVSEQATATTGMLDAYAGDIMSAGKLDADQKRFRIAELEQRIEEAGYPPKSKFVKYVLVWLSELAYLYLAIGDLDTAEVNIRESLRIAEKFDIQIVIASAYSNLGIIYQTHGDLDKAEKMLKKSLEINKKVGRLKGIGYQYSNLAVIYQTRGDLEKAEQMLTKSLEIFKKLNLLEGIATQYGNLGVIYQVQGDLKKAEEMFHKVLDVENKLGRPESIATAYGNLGLIYQTRGDLEKAEQMFTKSLKIEEKFGRLEGMANQYGNLGVIYLTCGEIDKAEQMFTKSLDIEEKIERLEGIARQYANLGLVYKQRKKVEKAREFSEKALKLFKKIRIPLMVGKVQEQLDELGKNSNS
jgi:tetratricopeptide (TPR) repeat protein